MIRCFDPRDYDVLQDYRAEYMLEHGELLTHTEARHKLTTPAATHGGREDDVRVAPQGFPSRATVIHGRATDKAGRDGQVARPQSKERHP